MVYCGRCGNAGHSISSCLANYDRDGEKIDKSIEAEKNKSRNNKYQAVQIKKGQRWSKEDDEAISQDIDGYIKQKAKEFGRSERAIYLRIIKILDKMSL